MGTSLKSYLSKLLNISSTKVQIFLLSSFRYNRFRYSTLPAMIPHVKRKKRLDLKMYIHESKKAAFRLNDCIETFFCNMKVHIILPSTGKKVHFLFEN